MSTSSNRFLPIKSHLTYIFWRDLVITLPYFYSLLFGQIFWYICCQNISTLILMVLLCNILVLFIYIMYGYFRRVRGWGGYSFERCKGVGWVQCWEKCRGWGGYSFWEELVQRYRSKSFITKEFTFYLWVCLFLSVCVIQGCMYG